MPIISVIVPSHEINKPNRQIKPQRSTKTPHIIENEEFENPLSALDELKEFLRRRPILVNYPHRTTFKISAKIMEQQKQKFRPDERVKRHGPISNTANDTNKQNIVRVMITGAQPIIIDIRNHHWGGLCKFRTHSE
ncbi:hypothetical protein JTB14_005657 [Gonioctena quinquepunctata]|nr:hypothetical protein JTB14_005657 [Gonioctena quinquepunctata]